MKMAGFNQSITASACRYRRLAIQASFGEKVRLR